MSPSPIVDDSQRVSSDTAASASATAAITRASTTTLVAGPPCTIVSTTLPASIGVATVNSAVTMLNPDKGGKPAVMPGGKTPDPCDQRTVGE
jgi:hypothetical protein